MATESNEREVTTPGPPAQPAPTAPGERIEVLDILRGFALFGVLAVNMLFFANPFLLYFAESQPWSHPIDHGAEWLISFFCTGKFYSLFSLLFGFGMAVQMSRVEARGGRFVRLYARRLFVLFGIGVCHVVFLWDGDILVHYALLGFLLLAFRKRARTTLITWAIPCLFLTTLVTAGFIGLARLAEGLPETPTSAPTTTPATEPSATPTTAATSQPDDTAFLNDWIDEAREVYAHGSYSEILVHRLGEYAFVSIFTLLFMYGGVFGMFLLGLYTARRGVLHDVATHVGFIRRVAFWGLVLGVVGNLTTVVGAEYVSPTDPSWIAMIIAAANAIGAPALCLFYAAGIVLLVQKEAWKRRLSPLAAVGRTALSNYLLQSLVCTMVFNGYGLGLFGTTGPAFGLSLTIAVYLLQILLSVWWLRRFRFGPAEWLWRSLTYAKLQPIRQAADKTG